MGQSIQHITLCSIGKDALTTMADSANKLILKKDYKLGGGYCRFTQRDSEILYSIIDSNYCEINSIIERSVEEDTLVCRPKVKKTGMENMDGCCCENTNRCNCGENNVDSKTALYELWRSRGNTGTMEDFLDALFEDEKMNWFDLKW